MSIFNFYLSFLGNFVLSFSIIVLPVKAGRPGCANLNSEKRFCASKKFFK